MEKVQFGVARFVSGKYKYMASVSRTLQNLGQSMLKALKNQDYFSIKENKWACNQTCNILVHTDSRPRATYKFKWSKL